MPVDQHRDGSPDPGSGMPVAPVHRFPGGEAGASRGVASNRVPDAWSTAWILAILLLVLTATIGAALELPEPARMATMVPFALLAPGMAVARLARLDSRVAELALGIVLSVTISGLVASALLGFGMWDPGRAVVILALGTVVALELDPRIPSRVLVWREYWNAFRGRAARLARAKRSMPHPSARLAEPLPPPPVAIVRRGPRRAPVTAAPAKAGGRRPALGENPFETPAISRHLRSAIDGVIDDLAARKDVPSP